MILREFLATFGIKMDEKGLNDANSRINKFAAGAQKALVALGFLYVGNKVKQFVQEQINLADHLKDMSIALGVNVADLQRLGFAFEQSGASKADFEAGLGKLNNLIGQAAGGSEEAQKALKGIDWRGAANGSIDSGEAFLQAADAIAKIENPTIRARKAQELFGRGGKTLIAGLAEGREGLKKLGDQFDKTGAGFTKEDVESADAFNDSLNVLKNSLYGLGRGLVRVFLGDGPNALDKIAEFVQGLRAFLEETNILKAALIVLTGVTAIFAATWIVANAPLIAGAAIIAGIVLVVEDLITMFNGGDSAVGEFIDSFMGVGTSATFVANIFGILKDSWNTMVDALRSSGLMTLFEGILKFVGGAFIAGITGAFLVITEIFLGVTKAITSIANAIEIVTGKVQQFGNWIHSLGLDSLLGVDTSSGPKPKQFPTGPQPAQQSMADVGVNAPMIAPFPAITAGSAPTFALPNVASPSMANNKNETSINNTQSSNISVTVNTGSNANGDEIASKAAQEVRKVMEDDRRKALESLRRTARPVGAT